MVYTVDFGCEDSWMVMPIGVEDYGDEDNVIIVYQDKPRLYSSPFLPITITNLINYGADSGGVDPPELTLKIPA